MQITPRDTVRIAARAEVTPRTVSRAYNGCRTYDTTRARIERAARELELPPPPPPASGNT